MLVIKRKESESVLIGDEIEIIISEISQDKVKLAINAPKNIKIARKELVETCEFNIKASGKISKLDVNNIRNNLKERQKSKDL